MLKGIATTNANVNVASTLYLLRSSISLDIFRVFICMNDFLRRRW